MGPCSPRQAGRSRRREALGIRSHVCCNVLCPIRQYVLGTEVQAYPVCRDSFAKNVGSRRLFSSSVTWTSEYMFETLNQAASVALEARLLLILPWHVTAKEWQPTQNVCHLLPAALACMQLMAAPLARFNLVSAFCSFYIPDASIFARHHPVNGHQLG